MESLPSRIETIEDFLSGEVPAGLAAERLGLHRVSFWRLVKRYRNRGADILRHGLTGRRSNRALPENFRQSVCEAYRAHRESVGGSVRSFYRSRKDTLLQDVSYVTVLTWVREI
ncbi:MAG TPA: hypothetical protein VFX30_07215 [bacterium]|nr:hypothetical protein [bacterium]